MAWNTEYPYIDPNRVNIDWAINQVKEFGKTLDSWKSTIDSILEALKTIDALDERITALENATADLETIRNNIAALEQGLANANARINDTNARIDNITLNYDVVLEEIERLAGLFPSYLELAKKYTDNQLELFFIKWYTEILALQREIEELKKLIPDNIFNSVRGQNFPLQKAYDLAYNDMREDALNVAQFAELGLTANGFEDLGLNNISFSLHSRSIFKWDYVTAPISKLYKPIAQAINEVIEFVLGSFTVDEFAALDLTCDQFAALDYTCMDYMAANDSNRGLTDEQFVDIIKSSGSNLLRI